jgi:uncharacterized protein YndB with AHSA1/START domain
LKLRLGIKPARCRRPDRNRKPKGRAEFPHAEKIRAQKCRIPIGRFVVSSKPTQTGNTKMTAATASSVKDRELVLTRLIDAPRAAVWRCWTEPELMKQWFAPAPWTTPRAEVDVRPGGKSFVVMADEDGNEYPNPGTYLEVVENEKLVFTDAYTGDWQPGDGKPFATFILTFEDEGGKTRYTARALHWTIEDKQQHEKMGFQEGFGQCADQLEKVAKGL